MSRNTKKGRLSARMGGDPGGVIIPAKRKKGIPENQLKLERVLKSASRDLDILESVSRTSKPRNRVSQNTKTKCKPNTTESKEKAKAKLSKKISYIATPTPHQAPQNIGSKKRNELKYTEGDDRKLSSKARKNDLVAPPRQQCSTSKQGNNPEHSEHLKTKKPTKRTKSEVPQASREHASKKGRSKEAVLTKTKRKCQVSAADHSSAQSAICGKNPHKSSKHKVAGDRLIIKTSALCIAKPKTVANSKSSSSKAKLQTSEKRKVAARPKVNLKPASTKSPVVKAEVDSDSDESDWEEVEDVSIQDESKSQVPSEPVTITLQGPNLMHKKRKREQADIEAYIRRRINRADQELQLQMHKVHLLCLLSHGFHCNRTCKDAELLAHGLSVVPGQLADRHYLHWDGMHLGAVVTWFHGVFSIQHGLGEDSPSIKQRLIRSFTNRKVASERELVLMLVLVLRGLGAQVRLVMSLQPVPYRRPKLLKDPKSNVREDEKETKQDEPKAKAKPPPPSPKLQAADSEVMALLKSTEGKKTPPGGATSKKPALKNLRMPREPPSGTHRTKSLKRRSCASKVNYADDLDGLDALSPRDTKKSVKWEKASRAKSPEVIELVSSDSDFEEVSMMLRKGHSGSKSSKKGKSSRRSNVDSDSEGDDVKTDKAKKGTDYFLEVYLERAESWIPVDCIRARVNCAEKTALCATQPVSYMLAYDNDFCIKDVTSRYAPRWMSMTRKLRRDEPWWQEVLAPYAPRNRSRDRAEDSRLHSQQLKKPLPTSISDYKNHPLYVLKRHLLKFEAIYPADAEPAGFIKGEPVYGRRCVHELHTRESWLKEGRAVRVDETPYKLVKARKKPQPRRTFEVDMLARPGAELAALAECFGRWQTERYMPLPAHDGRVPRNTYGNVEVFRPWMVPAGAVHLRLPGLQKVARKLSIDCAPAMTGWDFHGGFNHPVMDGFIVCEEHKDILIAAWDEEQEIQSEKEAEKREEKAVLNWKRLVKSALLRERMKARYHLQEAGGGDGGGGGEQPARDVHLAWPANRPDFTKKLSTADQAALFPSEDI